MLKVILISKLQFHPFRCPSSVLDPLRTSAVPATSLNILLNLSVTRSLPVSQQSRGNLVLISLLNEQTTIHVRNEYKSIFTVRYLLVARQGRSNFGDSTNLFYYFFVYFQTRRKSHFSGATLRQAGRLPDQISDDILCSIQQESKCSIQHLKGKNPKDSSFVTLTVRGDGRLGLSSYT